MSETSASNGPIATEWSETDELRREILRLRDELIGSEAQLGELRARLRVESERRRFEQERRVVSDLEHVMTVNADLEQQVSEMKGSTTWRLGRAIVRPFSLLRRPAGRVLPDAGPISR